MKKMFLAFSAIALSLILMACGNSSAEEQATTTNTNDNVIVVGAQASGFPQGFVEDGELKGFSIDVTEAVFEEAGYEVQWEIADWNGLLASLATGKIDTLTNFAQSEERLETYNFTDPYFYSRTGLAVAENNTSINSLEDLHGKTVVNILGSNYGSTLREADPQVDFDMVTLLNLPIAIQMVNSGKVGAIVQGYESLLAQVQQRGLPLRILDQTFSERLAGYPFRKTPEYDPVIEDLNQAILTLQEDGTLAEISETWFGQDVTVSQQNKEKEL